MNSLRTYFKWASPVRIYIVHTETHSVLSRLKFAIQRKIRFSYWLLNLCMLLRNGSNKGFLSVMIMV